MPKISKKEPETARSKDKLDMILNALLTSPEAACVVGDGCGCGAYGGELIEAMSAFLSHSDAARKLFVAKGGLHVSHSCCTSIIID